MKHLTIKGWAMADRPREKLLMQGRRALSDAELLAILIGSGTTELTAVDVCKQVLHHVEEDLEKLAALSVRELCKFRGIGEAKAITLIAALELCYRRALPMKGRSVELTCSQQVFELMKRHFAGLKQEEFWIILLNRANKLIAQKQISVGGLSETIVDPKVIFPFVLEHHASYVILVHNHPSGNVKPSKEDIAVTQKLCLSSAMLDVTIADHLIFAGQHYFSFRDHEMMP